MRMPFSMTTLLLLVFLLAPPALADDRCADILQQGTLQLSNINSNSYFQQIIHSRFINTTFEQSKKDTKAGFGASLGSYFFDGDYSEAQFRQKQNQIDRELKSKVTATQEIDVALTSGDPTIVNAWTKCMNEKGGWLELKLVPKSGRTIFGEITWHPGLAGTATGQPFSKLVDDVVIDDGEGTPEVVSGERCLKAELRLTSAPCKFVIRTKNSLTALSAIASTELGSAEAYLPPRLVFKKELRPYVFKEADYLEQHHQNGTNEPSKTIYLSEDEIKDGWAFKSQSAAIKLVVVEKQRFVHYCDNAAIYPELFKFSYSYRGVGVQSTGRDRATGIRCKVIPSISIERNQWVPMS